MSLELTPYIAQCLRCSMTQTHGQQETNNNYYYQLVMPPQQLTLQCPESAMSRHNKEKLHHKPSNSIKHGQVSVHVNILAAGVLSVCVFVVCLTPWRGINTQTGFLTPDLYALIPPPPLHVYTPTHPHTHARTPTHTQTDW